MSLTKIFYRILYCFTRRKKYKKLYKEKWGVNNKLIIIDENGNAKEFPPNYDLKIKWLDIHWEGSNNTVIIELPVDNLHRLEIHLIGDNNNVQIGKLLKGSFRLFLINGNNNVKFGEVIDARSMTITLNSADLTIGNNCMIADSVHIVTDGHSVIDAKTKDLLNGTRANIKIGNHVWLGFGTTLLKNTEISDNSIVANSAVVTKPFKEENVVIAGNPAKVVKRGINWNQTAPVLYSKETADFSF